MVPVLHLFDLTAAAMNHSQVELEPYEYSYYEYSDETEPTTSPKE